jgi:hypothetical protein
MIRFKIFAQKNALLPYLRVERYEFTIVKSMVH